MKNLITPYTESGITIDLPDEIEFFCFENCEGYRILSGYHFKEMDIGWYDSSENTLYLVELKDFTSKNIKENVLQIAASQMRLDKTAIAPATIFKR